ncbi:hypothetical protein E2C01_013672 [Portunus trituberculatus]|uniref:Uncharacterized protein n=1 Tax=Portunus trituberculatus TaxID=210409 RepID=A0A5B7DH89_PORTR|nr:hypothetical protein [Portunus trituberculatus]
MDYSAETKGFFSALNLFHYRPQSGFLCSLVIAKSTRRHKTSAADSQTLLEDEQTSPLTHSDTAQ